MMVIHKNIYFYIFLEINKIIYLINLYKCKEAILASFNLGLTDGIHFEKRLFHSSFAMVNFIKI